MTKSLTVASTVVALAALLAPASRAADAPAANAPAADKLATILVPGEDWQVVAENLTFADGPANDAEGNFYYSDLRAAPPGIYKVSPDGKPTKLAAVGRSGTKMGPDGRLYGCGNGQVAAYDLPGGKETIVAGGTGAPKDSPIQPNDLAVSARGHVYITETRAKQVTLVDPKTGQHKVVDTGARSPNGITLSADQSRLYVSESAGETVWSFAVQPDGTLADKKPLGTMKSPPAKTGVSGGDGMTVDTANQCYVTSALGVQVFSPAGELLGIVPKPKEGPMTSCGFAGKDHAYLYVTCGDKIYRRRTQAKGVLFFQPPAPAAKG